MKEIQEPIVEKMNKRVTKRYLIRGTVLHCVLGILFYNNQRETFYHKDVTAEIEDMNYSLLKNINDL
jgi:hypothetical protein